MDAASAAEGLGGPGGPWGPYMGGHGGCLLALALASQARVVAMVGPGLRTWSLWRAKDKE